MTEWRTIVLARHGQVDVSWFVRIAGSSFAEFVRRFEEAGVAADTEPSESARRHALEANILVGSAARRAVESARAFAPDRAFVSNALFREAPIPSGFHTRIPLRANTWAIVARALWYLHQWPGTESVRDTRARARRATSLLECLVDQYGSVSLVGHGCFNSFIARELRARGWQGPRFPGTRYWGTSTTSQLK
jgi:broad specificity phosphatase PhoE